MSSKIDIKHSSSPGVVPTTSSLNLGEFAINTYDGKVFIKKDNGTPYIVEIGSGSGGTTNPAGSNTQIQYNNNGSFGANSSFTFNYASQSLQQGNATTASGLYSHAEGWLVVASDDYAHAEGYLTTASALAAHAEGRETTARGNYSHAEGWLTTTIGSYSHAEGLNTVASGSSQTVVGKYNTQNNTSSLFIVGGGLSDTNRKDIFDARVDTNGSGSIKIPTNTANPNSVLTGSMYFNPTTNLLYIYNGTAWKSASFA
jgi:hypothetical protein